jgi:hypothetical protein
MVESASLPSNGASNEVADLIYCSESTSGEGAGLSVGQSIMKPPGNSVGVTRKLRLDTALYMLKKYSVISLDEKT